MKMKVKMRRVFGIIFSLVLVLGLMPGMSMTVCATETTIRCEGTYPSINSMFPQNGIIREGGANEAQLYSGGVFKAPEGKCFTKITMIEWADNASTGSGCWDGWNGGRALTVTQGQYIIPNTPRSNKIIIDFTVDDLAIYDVTLNTNGGTVNDGNITTYTEFYGATLPTNVTRNGYIFEGWYDNAELTGEPVTSIASDATGNKEYWAKWESDPNAVSYNVTYKVVNGAWDEGDKADRTITLTGVNITLGAENIPHVGTKPDAGYKEGSWDVTPTAGTSITGDVTFTYTYAKDISGESSGGSSDSGNTSGGTSSGSSDNTNTNTDTSAKVPYDDVPISTGSVNDITGTAAATAESNPFGTKIENNSNLTTLLSLTDAEVAQGVNVWLDIQDMSSSVSKTDKSMIAKKSGDYTVGMYLDINLFKKVGNNDATKVSETNGKIKASIVIPKKLRKSGRTFEIIRVHNGKAATITGTYTKKTHVFTFETDKFSTYAIAYKDAASSTDSETTDSSSTATTTSTTTTTTASTGSIATTATAPKTGDGSDMRVWLMFVIVSFAGLGVYAVSRKKRASK